MQQQSNSLNKFLIIILVNLDNEIRGSREYFGDIYIIR
jgi:hypothetical protein